MDLDQHAHSRGIEYYFVTMDGIETGLNEEESSNRILAFFDGVFVL